MLKANQQKWLFLAVFAVISGLQLYLIIHQQLFGDEAFYWLESQHLAWSYAELPAWTQWVIAGSQTLLPQSEFSVRLPGFIAALSIPWLAIYISRLTTNHPHNQWQAGLFSMALPLLPIAGILAVPDIWLVFFGLLSVLCLILSVQHQRNIWFIGLGVILALGINVHLRFWLIVFLAALVFFWQFKQNSSLIKKWLYISLPIMMIGFLPIIYFNIQNDYPLLQFQLSDRHPWQFQISHLQFFLIQFLITTPLVFILCVTTLLKQNKQQKIWLSLIYLATAHWLIYALVGFFSDNLRFNIHWTIFSYVLALIVASSQSTQRKTLAQWAVVTGTISSFALLLLMCYWLNNNHTSRLNAQFTENSQGWDELASKTQQLLNSNQSNQAVAGNFMTLAELKFYLPQSTTLYALSHPLNIKHGREQQLAIMEYTTNTPQTGALLIVEHTALKLEEQIPFYQHACEQLNGMQLIDTLSYQQGIKNFNFFKTGGGSCELPTISYFQQQDNQLTGWVVVENNDIPSIELKPTNASSRATTQVKPLGNNPLFSSLDNSQYQLIEFKIDITHIKSDYQVHFNYTNRSAVSERLFSD